MKVSSSATEERKLKDLLGIKDKSLQYYQSNLSLSHAKKASSSLLASDSFETNDRRTPSFLIDQGSRQLNINSANTSLLSFSPSTS